MKMFAVLLGASAVLWAQGTTPRKSVAEYPVQSKFEDFELGVEYMVRSFGSQEQTLITEDFLTVEVAVYPVHGRIVKVDGRTFQLRLNGKDEPLLAQSAGMVAAAIKYPDWNRRSAVSVGAGPVIIGGAPQTGRFPGDRRAEPPVVQQPQPREEPKDFSEVVQSIVLPEGPTKHPISGFLFFPHRGKLKSLKKVELLVKLGAEEKAITLK